MKIPMHFGARGLFRMDAINVDTGEVRELAPWQDNLITDVGLNTFGGWKTSGGVAGDPDYNASSNSPTSFCWVGSGSTPPAFTDVLPAAFVARTQNKPNATERAVATAAPWYLGGRNVFQFAVGAAAGNLTEVGLDNGASTTSNTKYWMFSRALIKNAQGNPITVTVLPNEILQVTYETRTYIDTVAMKEFKVMDGATEVTVRMVPHDLPKAGSTAYWVNPLNTGRFIGFSSYAWGVSTVVNSPRAPTDLPPLNTPNANTWYGGTQVSPTTGQTFGPVDYPWGTHKKGWKQTLGVNVTPAAFTNLNAFYNLSTDHGFVFNGTFSPGLAKTADETLTLEWEITWGRYTP